MNIILHQPRRLGSVRRSCRGIFESLIILYIGLALYISGKHNDTTASSSSYLLDMPNNSRSSSHSVVKTVDFQHIDAIEPVNIGQLNSTFIPYLVSFAWWDGKIKKVNFLNKRPIWAHPTVREVQRLIEDTEISDAFIDVGANVGFMALFALNRKQPVFAVEPISYNIAKICEGIDANIERGWCTLDNARQQMHLYHAAAGEEWMASVNITRPSDEIGHFDAASLSKEALGQEDLVTETIPLITVDSIIPDDMNVGVVKIDVQGHEIDVLRGMEKILSRRKGYPKYVIYEDDHLVTKLAGNKPGACKQLLEDHGYTCGTTSGGDTLCEKFEDVVRKFDIQILESRLQDLKTP